MGEIDELVDGLFDLVDLVEVIRLVWFVLHYFSCSFSHFTLLSLPSLLIIERRVVVIGKMYSKGK